MPSLNEFVNSVMAENNITADSNQIIEKITEIARQRAVGGCCAISDDEIREMVINNAELVNKLAEEKAEKEKQEKEKARQERLKKELEEERKAGNGEQTALF